MRRSTRHSSCVVLCLSLLLCLSFPPPPPETSLLLNARAQQLSFVYAFRCVSTVPTALCVLCLLFALTEPRPQSQAEALRCPPRPAIFGRCKAPAPVPFRCLSAAFP